MNEERKNKLKLLRAQRLLKDADEAEGVVTEYLKGDPGSDGKDATLPSELELKEIIEPLIPTPIKGDPGSDGQDGKTPTKKELAGLIEPLIPKAIPGKNGKDGKTYTYVGSWKSGQAYKEGDVVEHEGSSFVTLQDHTSKNINEPDKGSEWLQYWGVVARKGAKGQDGYSSGGGGGGSSSGVQSVTAGTNVTITGTAQNPIINATGGGASTWGSITGTLSSQTDLQSALDAKQPLDTDLTTIAGLTATTDNVIQSVGSAWASRSPAQLKTSMSFVKADVGLSNVDNTSDATKNTAVATLTNKTILATTNVTEEITGTTSSATPAPTGGSLRNAYDLTALAVGATFAAPSGTPAHRNKLWITIKDNGTAQTLAWNAAYVAGGVALPTTTVLGKILNLGFMYNTNNGLNKWQLVASAQEA